MKILRIIPSMHPKHGGPSQGIRNSIAEMRKFGVENEVVCLDDSNSDYLGKDDFKIYTLEGTFKSWRYNSNLMPWLLENFSKYDVVIVHGLWLYHSIAAYKAITIYRKKNSIGPKMYVMPHGMLDPYFQKAKGRKLKAMRNWIYWKLIEKKVVNELDGVLFTCQEELLLARQAFTQYEPKSELNVGYGIHEPIQYTQEMRDAFKQKVPLWNEKPFILYLSRINEKKGIDILIKSYLTMQKQRQSLPQLIIAGPGLDTNYGKEILSIVSGHPDIVFPGMLAGLAKWGAFYNCEIFILPSHQENFGIAIVEAMACKKPVLISNKVNIWREIQNENAGLVCSDNEASTFEHLNKWLSFTESEKNQIGENAYSAYQKYFSISEVAKRMITMLKNTG